MCYDSTVTFLRLYKPGKAAIAIFALALFVRLLFLPFSLLGGSFEPGSAAADGYYEISVHVLHGDGFERGTLAAPIVDDVRTPLYPLIIAGVVWLTGSYKILLLLQVLVGSIIPLLGKKIAELLTGHRGIAIGTGVLLAVEPFGAWVSSFMLTETFFTFFFLAGCVAFFSYLRDKKLSQILLFAVLFGCATLVKPTTQFLPLLFIIILFFAGQLKTKRAWTHMALMLVVFYLILAPWMYRNERVWGNSSLSVQTVSATYAYLIPSAMALQEHIPFAVAQPQLFAEDGYASIEDVTLSNSAIFKALIIQHLPRYPVGLAKSLAVTGYAFFTNDGYLTFTNRYPLLSFDFRGATASSVLKNPTSFLYLLSYPGMWLIAAGRAFWILCTLLAFLGLYLYMTAKNSNKLAGFFAGFMVFYFMATTAIIGLAINGRFRYPVDTFMFIFMLVACVSLVAYWKSRRAYKHIAQPIVPLRSTPAHYEGRDLETMSFAQNYHAWIRDIFKPFLGDKVAEVGAGSGNFSSLLLQSDIKELVAVEPSQEMYPLLKKRLEGDLRVVTRQALFKDICGEYKNQFDAIVYVNVLEHVKDHEQELLYIHDALREGGYACIFVPALQGLYSPLDKEIGHYRRYSKGEVRQLLEAAGFEVVKLTYFDIVGIVPWFIFMKVLKKKLQGGDVAIYDKAVIPVMRAIETHTWLPVGKNVLAVARKRAPKK